MGLASVLNVADAHRAARRVLPKSIYDYVAGGAEDELTIQRNRDAYGDYYLRPQAASAVVPDLSTTVLGVPVSMPVVLAPCGQLSLVHPDGDLATTAASRALGTTSIAAHGSGHSLAEVAGVGGVAGNGFFQIYKLGGRAGCEYLVERARAAGFRGMVITVDTPTNGNRERDRRNGYARGLKVDLHNALRYGPGLATRPAWLYRFARGGLVFELANVVDPERRAATPAGEMAALLTASPFDWDDVKWLRSLWPDGPVTVKGLLTAADARRAVDCGADAVVVSNHGGRQLDSAPGTLDVLPEVVAEVGDEIEVFLDGGVRRGTDVIKAVALGARAVLIGRPYIWGLAIGGQAGVEHVLQILRSEIERSMVLLGCASLADLDESVLMRLPR